MENVMYCKNCGMKLENGAKFCGRCGMPVDNELFENIQEEMETLVATSVANSATIQSISETIAAQNNSVKDILAEIDEIAGVSTKLEEHFDMEQAQCE